METTETTAPRGHAIAFVDVRFKSVADMNKAWRALGRLGTDKDLEALATKARGWLFYAGDLADTAGPPLTERLFRKLPARDGNMTRGTAVTALKHATEPIVILGCWQPYSDRDPQSGRMPEVYLTKYPWSELLPIIPEIADCERVFSFMTAAVKEEQFRTIMEGPSPTLGRWLTGDFEHETETALKATASRNLSHRSYECLLLRWSDGLSVCALDGTVDDGTVGKTGIRAALLFETCVLLRALVRKHAQEIRGLTAKISGYRDAPLVSARRRRAARLSDDLASVRLTYIVAPPVVSPEANRLLDRALEECDIPRLLRGAEEAYGALERRLQWVQLQWVALLTVAAFLLTTVISVLKN